MEELHPDLKPFIHEQERLGLVLRHPLVYSVPYFEAMNSFLNTQYLAKKQKLQECKQCGDYRLILLLHERPYRIDAFFSIESELPDQEYWQLLKFIWTDSENIWQNLRHWKVLLSSSRAKKEYFMNEADRQALQNLPDKITVYRGYVPRQNKNGLSYSLDRSKAEWFAKRFADNGKVIVKKVEKTDIFALLTDRNEDEVILTPYATS